MAILNGEKGHKRNAVLMNAGASFYIGGKADSLADGIKLAAELIDSGKALRKEGLSFICECKKASPSKGIIEADFQYLQIAKEYEMAGADCISVLTEPKWFLGADEYLKQIAAQVSIPCLRKDFTVDTNQSKKLRDRIPPNVVFVSESGIKNAEDIRSIREMGADAVLIGETLMRAADKKAKLDELRGVL